MEINFPLFKNDRKEKESQPDYKFYDGEEGREAAAWIKKSPKGTTYMSVVFKDGADSRKPETSHDTKPEESKPDDLDDDIPF